MKVRVAVKHPINILGAFTATFNGMSPNNRVVEADDFVFISDSVDGFFLFYDTMVDLLIVNKNFTTIGSCQQSYQCDNLRVSSMETECPNATSETSKCDCPRHTQVPLRPESLPFKVDESNNEKMETWLRNR